MVQKYLSTSNQITQWIILLDCFGIFIWRLTKARPGKALEIVNIRRMQMTEQG